ncbi:MAG TPA: transglutaminase family protein [Polyangiaceae bacterium]|nr:transglutaminase family protein [Polyangiaceae bacterium]
MRYNVRHVTRYHYEAQVAHAHHLAHLRPRELPTQRVEHSRIDVLPVATAGSSHADYFGNIVDSFEIFGSHDTLQVTCTSVVTTLPNSLVSTALLMNDSWEQAAAQIAAQSSDTRVSEYVCVSPLLRPGSTVRSFVREVFTPQKPLVAAVLELSERIFTQFKYEVAATDVTTPINQVLGERRGVCQDFAHIAIASLRALGLAARYVSGYMETLPPPGQPRLIGADASHAWASVYVPGAGWLDFDPTNNTLPGERYVTVAYGRDFSDVSPIKGVVLGGGAHQISVGVDVEPTAPSLGPS